MSKDYRVANRFGRCFPRKKEKFDLNDLTPAYHIVEESKYGLKITFWHHLIVESVDSEKKQINAIHYNFDLDAWLKLASIHRSSLEFTPNKFYRIVYEDNECRPPEEVLKRARERLNEKSYRPFINDCENFATVCKTSENTPHQIWTVIEILGKSGISAVLRKWHSRSTTTVLNIVEYGAKCSTHLPMAIVISMIVCSRDFFVAKVKFDKGKLTREEFCEVVVRRVCTAICSFVVFATGVLTGVFIVDLSVIVAVVFETILCCHDIYVAKVKFDKGKLTREELCEVVVRRVCAQICSIPGFGIGFFIGGPIVEYITKGLTVALGQFVGGALGDFLSKEAGGKYLGDLFTPTFVECFCKNDA